MNLIKKYYSSEEDFNTFYYSMKLIQCPYCHLVGTLILHGYLYGYPETNESDKIKRGRRIFCNNRKKGKGCGKTFSMLLSYLLKRFNIQAKSIWKFLQNIASGMNKKAAFTHLNLSFSDTTIYRLYNKFVEQQPLIRTRLNEKCREPKNLTTDNPVIGTIEHLKKTFKKYSCPIVAFQDTFQIPFF